MVFSDLGLKLIKCIAPKKKEKLARFCKLGNVIFLLSHQMLHKSWSDWLGPDWTQLWTLVPRCMQHAHAWHLPVHLAMQWVTKVNFVLSLDLLNQLWSRSWCCALHQLTHKQVAIVFDNVKAQEMLFGTNVLDVHCMTKLCPWGQLFTCLLIFSSTNIHKFEVGFLDAFDARAFLMMKNASICKFTMTVSGWFLLMMRRKPSPSPHWRKQSQHQMVENQAFFLACFVTCLIVQLEHFLSWSKTCFKMAKPKDEIVIWWRVSLVDDLSPSNHIERSSHNGAVFHKKQAEAAGIPLVTVKWDFFLSTNHEWNAELYTLCIMHCSDCCV